MFNKSAELREKTKKLLENTLDSSAGANKQETASLSEDIKSSYQYLDDYFEYHEIRRVETTGDIHASLAAIDNLLQIPVIQTNAYRLFVANDINTPEKIKPNQKYSQILGQNPELNEILLLTLLGDRESFKEKEELKSSELLNKIYQGRESRKKQVLMQKEKESLESYSLLLGEEIALLELLTKNYISAMAADASIIYLPDETEIKELKSKKSVIDRYIKSISKEHIINSGNPGKTGSIHTQPSLLDEIIYQAEAYKSNLTSNLIAPDRVYIPETVRILEDDKQRLYAGLENAMNTYLNQIAANGKINCNKLLANDEIKGMVAWILAAKSTRDDYIAYKNIDNSQNPNEATHIFDNDVTNYYHHYKEMLGNNELANYVFLTFNYNLRISDIKIAYPAKKQNPDNEQKCIRYKEDMGHIIALAVLMDRNMPQSSNGIIFPKPHKKLVSIGKEHYHLSIYI